MLIQTSPEAPHIFRLLHRINTAQKTAELKAAAIKSGVSDADFTSFMVYCNGFYDNIGNYKGFGDTKIVPKLPVESFEAIVEASQAHTDNPTSISALWKLVKGPMYKLTKRQKQLGLGCKGVTTYFSDNCDQEDADRITRYFGKKSLEGWINRAFKTVSEDGKITYEIRNAGIESNLLSSEDFEGATFNVTTGDYSELLKLVAKNLNQAMEYVANDEERRMLYDYVKSFTEGSIDAHKDGSRHWIRNKSPSVETYLGFVENYRDPVGIRSEFEGFVAMVNKEKSKKFQALVDASESIVPLLPWPKEFEKDKFLKPDFTSLDVLTFAGSSKYSGINIPNYDEIRQTEGFKNVNLGNIVSALKKPGNKTNYVSKGDHELIHEWELKSYEVQVAFHELTGHGSGKLFTRNKDGTFNFDETVKNPLTGKPVGKFYDVGETYNSKFTTIGTSYEECRAEAVAIYLSTYEKAVNIFGFHGDDAATVNYVSWLTMARRGIIALQAYSPDTKEWTQAHARARFVILQVMLNAGEGFATVKEITGKDGQPDLLLSLDRNKIESVGKPAIGQFLQKLQIYKTLGDDENGRKLFEELSKVKETGPHPFAKWRDIVLARKQPKSILVQANTVVGSDGKVALREYEASHEGFIQSWAERFPAEEFAPIEKHLAHIAERDQTYFTSTV